jgi:acetyl-CoA synthetase
MNDARRLYSHAELSRVLNPRSVAIVGATPRAGAFGERVLFNLGGYGGRIHLVNARYERIGERPCHPSLAALPEPPDCVVITVARDAVEDVARDCVAAGAGGVIVFASGYAETGKAERIAAQERLTALARESGMPIIGPNCIGISIFGSGARITFMPSGDVPPPGRGAIGIASQSGALGYALAQAADRGVPISHVLTSGNSCDFDMADAVAYLADDPACAAIALLFEGMRHPRRLMAAAERAWAAGKPVVACKLAVGEQGARAALSHTGSLAGTDAAYRAAFERAGVVLVDGFEALIETACFLAKAPPPRARGVAVVATSGGAAIMAADKAEAHGVALPQPDAPARAVLAARVPEFGSARNPCDVTAQVLNDPESLPACMTALLEDDHFGALIVPVVYAGPATIARVPLYSRLARESGKPVCSVWLAEWMEGPGARESEADFFTPLFRSMDRCFAAIAAWHARADRASAVRTLPPSTPAPVRAEAAALLAAARERTLGEREAKTVLSLYGVPVVGERLVTDAEGAVAAADALGYPVALKIESPDLPHKTEAGVVRLNLRDAAEVRDAFDIVSRNAARVSPAPRITGVLVQPMVPAGVELMIGARVDPQFGPLIIVGFGGVLVEVLRDHAVGLAPVGREEALAMVLGLKGSEALRGFRGAAPVDLDALADIVVRVGMFVADHADVVAELDINPLICAGGRILAVDALIALA